MMNAPLTPLRNDRTTAVRGITAAPRGPSTPASGSDLNAQQQAQISAQHEAFDYDAAERAEIMREHEVLQALLMAFLKNEDEITKKWISLI